MKTTAIIQARMGSERLPGKVLADIAGRPMLWQVVDRVRRAKEVNEVIVATTNNPKDVDIIRWCMTEGIAVRIGNEQDVLDRYYQVARSVRADIIVRITADCPVIDPGVIDDVISLRSVKQSDYASNVLSRTFPRGLDVEVLTMAALTIAWQQAKLPYQREHVTPYLQEQAGVFSSHTLYADRDYSRYRWTVDTEEDLQLIRDIYARLGRTPFHWQHIISLMEKEPALALINAQVEQKKIHDH